MFTLADVPNIRQLACQVCCTGMPPRQQCHPELCETSCPQVLDLIDLGGSEGGAAGRHWVLDPIDGTRGFVGLRQYAICLGMLQDGQVRTHSAIRLCQAMVDHPRAAPTAKRHLPGQTAGQPGAECRLSSRTRTASAATETTACSCVARAVGTAPQGPLLVGHGQSSIHVQHQDWLRTNCPCCATGSPWSAGLPKHAPRAAHSRRWWRRGGRPRRQRRHRRAVHGAAGLWCRRWAALR